MKVQTFFVISFCFFALMLAFGKTEHTLEKAQTFITELKFYKAILALEPLLTSDEKSEKQEEALWVAHLLCESIFPLDDETEKAERLDQLGADVNRAPYEMKFHRYDYGFLKRLLELYPHSRWAPVAEYYLIKVDWLRSSGLGDPFKLMDDTRKALHSYVKEYAKSGRPEVYMAYLDIANINHGFWACLTFPDEPWAEGPPIYVADFFSSGDPEKDKKLASTCKAEALKYYAKFIVNAPGLHERKIALECYKQLEQNERFGFCFAAMDPGC